MNFKKEKRKLIFIKITRAIIVILMILSLAATAFTFLLATAANTVTSGKLTNLDKPFSVLVIGTDTGTGPRSSELPRSDALMLFAINPKNDRGNTEVTVTSVPRDTEVANACTGSTGKVNAIMNSTWDSNATQDQNITKGSECLKDSIASYFDIKIDYYVTADFAGLVTLIDGVGGIEIDVPYEIVEQNSKDEAGAITLSPGHQTLNGEQALAYARNRKSVIPEKGTSGDDWARNVRQQEVVMLTVAKILQNPGSHISAMQKVVQDNMWTNIFSDAGFLVSLTGFAGGIANRFNEVLADGQDVGVYYKTSEFGFNTYISPVEDMLKVSIDSLNTYDSDSFYGTTNTISKNTNVYALNYNHYNTQSPTTEFKDKIEPLSFEFQMETLATTVVPNSSNLVASQDTIDYFSAVMKETLEQ